MPSFHAGSRLPASHLNALTAVSIAPSGGPTSGTTELLLSGTLTISAAPIDRLVIASLTLQLATDTPDDRYMARIRDDTATGANRLAIPCRLGSTATESVSGVGEAFGVAAGTTHVLVATLQRLSSPANGAGSVAGGSNNNILSAQLFAAP